MTSGRWHRGRWAAPLGIVALGVFAAGVWAQAQPGASSELPVTGTANPDLRSFDDTVLAYMAKHKVPGASLAVVKDGRLVYARGYGYADTDAREPVQPTSLFRLASVSKPITSVAVMTLVRAGKLDLDAKAFPLLGLKPFLKPGQTADPRLMSITVRQLLQHTGGWDSAVSGDPMFQHFRIAGDMDIASPPDPTSIVRWMMGHPLDFDPGTRHAYSNFGYCVLGRIIEKVTRKSYETYVRDAVLKRFGIRDMRIGKGHREERAPGEVRYYDQMSLKVRAYDSGPEPRWEPVPYAFASPATIDANGGWIGSAVDLARFAAGLDAPKRKPLLDRKTTALMYARPEPPVGLDKDGKPADAYYACGWLVRPVGTDGRANYWHNGMMPGTFTLLVRRFDGLSWAILFNQRVDEKGLEDSIDIALHRAAAAVKRWPSVDLFRTYP